MRAVTKITFLDEAGEKFFGEGPYRLLLAVEETGSLRAAAISMGMAYTKALKLLKKAEAALGFPLTTREIGGRSGGGSCVTAEGAAWLSRYAAYRDACQQASASLYQQFFPEAACVIMASGLGKRFGGNKLLADFGRQPLICQAFAATEGLFSRRVVVTRHEAVAELAGQRGIDVVLHDLPHRSDTVRLGLEAVGDVRGCLFCPGDQPLLRRETVAALVQRWQAAPEEIWRLTAGDTPGTPVIFPNWAFPELRTLPEGKGGGVLIRKYPDRVWAMEADPLELRDVDTPEELNRLLSF